MRKWLPESEIFRRVKIKAHHVSIIREQHIAEYIHDDVENN
jgi:hypothetical protein